MIFETVVPWVVPILLAAAVVLFLKGHNAPGGGFIAGLLTAVALVLRFIAYGSDIARGKDRLYIGLIIAGLAVAVTTATVPTLLGYPFFTHTFGHVHVPVLGDIELASAALFDLGVYLVVVGNVVTVIAALTVDDADRSAPGDADGY
jgi:multicomponent K+:H+ antiporter subunit A